MLKTTICHQPLLRTSMPHLYEIPLHVAGEWEAQVRKSILCFLMKQRVIFMRTWKLKWQSQSRQTALFFPKKLWHFLTAWATNLSLNLCYWWKLKLNQNGFSTNSGVTLKQALLKLPLPTTQIPFQDTKISWEHKPHCNSAS